MEKEHLCAWWVLISNFPANLIGSKSKKKQKIKINVEFAMKTEIKTKTKTKYYHNRPDWSGLYEKRKKKNTPPELMKYDWHWLTENINFLTQGIFFLESL